MPSDPTTKTIVSVGYEQRDIADLIDLLTSQQVELLVDVRLNAISRKPGFSKTALAAALQGAGIEYRHQRELGNPKSNREPFRRGDRSARRRYEEHLRDGPGHVYGELVELAASVRLALLCYEREHEICHRSCITEAARAVDPSISILEL